MVLNMVLEQFRPKLKAELERILHQLFEELAEEQNPFQLVLRLSKQDQNALGQLLTKSKRVLKDFDAGALIQELFEQQIQQVSPMIRGAILKKLGGSKVEQEVIKGLEQGALLVRYDKNFTLQYYQEQDNTLRLIDIDTFFENLQF